jgi:cell division protein FtsI/penicillin-binding protein 2
MPNNMTATIRRLTMTFIILLLAISAVAAYVQVSNQAFIDGPTLSQGTYDPRACLGDAPVRGTIYDRNGIPLAWTVPDKNAPLCPFRRVYSTDAVNAGFGPLLGYFSYKRGVAGLEASFNDELAGIKTSDLQRQLLHEPRFGDDLYLTIDLRLQQKANGYYDSSAFYKHSATSVCQPAGSPPGSLVVEDPNTGEILALVSRPSFDPNRIDDDAYWSQLNNESGSPLIDHATLPTIPGSTFKTLTMIASLDNGGDLTGQNYDQATATHFQPEGSYDIEWVDYTKKGEWQNIQFPISMQDGYAYSDNTIFARVAVDVGKDKWLSTAEKFGIKVPGANVQPVPFDAPVYQNSSIYPA